MQLDENHYSVCFEYQDISFAKANYEEQENIFLKWVEYLHSFNYNDHIQVVCAGKPIKTDDYKKDYIYMFMLFVSFFNICRSRLFTFWLE